MRLALFIVAAAFASAQTITFSPQGAEFLRAQVGLVIPGEQALGIVVCGDANTLSVTGGAIYQRASAQGYSYILPSGVPSITSRSVQQNKSYRFVQYLKYGSLIAATVASGTIIHVPQSVVTGIIIGHGVMDDIQPYFAAKIPDPSVLLGGLIDPTKIYAIPGGTCIDGYIIAQYTGRLALPVAHPDLLIPSGPPNLNLPTVPAAPVTHGLDSLPRINTNALGVLPESWQLNRGDAPEETGLAAMRGGWGRQAVEVASR